VVDARLYCRFHDLRPTVATKLAEAGVQVTQMNGEPGGTRGLRVRGDPEPGQLVVPGGRLHHDGPAPEEIQFKAERLTNGSFGAYPVRRFRDMPKVDLVLLDRKDLEPAGAGETPIIAVAPAIANAVFDATGKRVRSMPTRVPPK
jgi:hypothetical protein